MAHISKKRLKANHLKKLFAQLSQIVSTLNQSSSEKFLTELLGPEEKIMLAKRFAAIAMFIEGNSIYRVSQLLHISPSTAERIKLNYECGRYGNIARLLGKHRRDYEEFWNTLEVILRLGMPPMGRGRWKSIKM